MVLVKSERVFKLNSADYYIVITVVSNSAVEDDLVKFTSISSCLALLRFKEDPAAVAILNVDNQ